MIALFVSSPFTAVFFFLPMVAILIGVALFKYKYVSLVLSFFLPLLILIDESGHFDMETFRVNIDAWFVYAVAYALLSFLSSSLLSKLVRKRVAH